MRDYSLFSNAYRLPCFSASTSDAIRYWGAVQICILLLLPVVLKSSLLTLIYRVVCRYKSTRCVYASTSVRRSRWPACSSLKSISSSFSHTRTCDKVRPRSKDLPPAVDRSSATQTPDLTRLMSLVPVSRLIYTQNTTRRGCRLRPEAASGYFSGGD